MMEDPVQRLLIVPLVARLLRCETADVAAIDHFLALQKDSATSIQKEERRFRLWPRATAEPRRAGRGVERGRPLQATGCCS